MPTSPIYELYSQPPKSDLCPPPAPVYHYCPRTGTGGTQACIRARPQFANKQPPPRNTTFQVSPWKAVRQPCWATKRAQNTALSRWWYSPPAVSLLAALTSSQKHLQTQSLPFAQWQYGGKWCNKKPLVPPCKIGRHQKIQLSGFFFC